MHEQNEGVVQALETIVQAVVGQELESIRSSVDDLRSDLCRRIEGVQEETSAALDEKRRELSAGLEELGKKLADADAKTDRALAELQRQVETTQAEAENRNRATRQALEHDLEATDRSIKEGLDDLASKLATVKQGLQRQMETSERLSGVLSNLASIFSGQAAAVAADSAGADLADAEERKELEHVLDKVFPAGS